MPAVVEKPRIQCRCHDEEDRQYPLDALVNEEYCTFHLPT